MIVDEGVIVEIVCFGSSMVVSAGDMVKVVSRLLVSAKV